MRLTKPFLKLPIRFDEAALAAEVRALPPSAWVPHPSGFVGNEAVRLVTSGGVATDELVGAMAPTENLQRCNYVRQIMEEIGGVWGQVRLMGLGPGREVPSHIDMHYYWRTHLRIHIPVITNTGVEFSCGDETVHMAAGECWVFDSFLRHDVQNKGSEQRIHLVLDTVGGGRLPALMQAAESGAAEARLVLPDERKGGELAFERVNSPKVMSPWEMRCHLAFIRERAGTDPKVIEVLDLLERFVDEWAANWARFEADEAGRPHYERLLGRVRADMVALGADNRAMPNGIGVGRVIRQLIFHMALAEPGRAFAGDRSKDAVPAARGPSAAAVAERSNLRTRFDRPIFVVSTPRSGSTLLYETLEQAPDLYSIGDESHGIIETIQGLAPRQRGWTSNRLTAEDATPERIEQLAQAFYRRLKDRDGRPAEGSVRMLEKTPKNALRVPFFDAIWPDSNFIYLYRDVRQTLHSMMEAWHSGGFRTYPLLPDWPGLAWSMILVPGWQRLRGLPLPEIVAHQWAITTNVLLDDLEQLDAERVHVVDYDAFVASPRAEMERLADRVDLSWDRALPTLRLSKTTVSQPDPHKWRRIESAIEAIWPIVEQADIRAREFLEQRLSSARPQPLRDEAGEGRPSFGVHECLEPRRLAADDA